MLLYAGICPSRRKPLFPFGGKTLRLLRVTGSQMQYIQARPIHPSQKLVEQTTDHLLLKLHLTPCYNFYQQLLWHREALEVVEPLEVKEEMQRIVQKLSKLYG